MTPTTTTHSPAAVTDRLPATVAVGSVVVGVDGSDDSLVALAVAKRAAAELGGGVTVVSSWEYPPVYGAYALMPPIDFAADAETEQRTVLAAAKAPADAVDVATVVEEGDAAQVLLERAEHAALLVVGSRGHGGLAGLLLGSTSMACVARATCPVLVVRTRPRPVEDAPRRPRVVVGVGAGEQSVEALRAGRRAALAMDAGLDVVTAWDCPGGYGAYYTTIARDLQAKARRDQQDTIQVVYGPDRSTWPNAILEEGVLARVLTEQSAHSDLLVLGRSLHGELSSVLLGAPTIRLAEHAACSVLVVPAVPRRS